MTGWPVIAGENLSSWLAGLYDSGYGRERLTLRSSLERIAELRRMYPGIECVFLIVQSVAFTNLQSHPTVPADFWHFR